MPIAGLLVLESCVLTFSSLRRVFIKTRLVSGVFEITFSAVTVSHRKDSSLCGLRYETSPSIVGPGQRTCSASQLMHFFVHIHSAVARFSFV